MGAGVETINYEGATCQHEEIVNQSIRENAIYHDLLAVEKIQTRNDLDRIVIEIDTRRDIWSKADFIDWLIESFGWYQFQAGNYEGISSQLDSLMLSGDIARELVYVRCVSCALVAERYREISQRFADVISSGIGGVSWVV